MPPPDIDPEVLRELELLWGTEAVQRRARIGPPGAGSTRYALIPDAKSPQVVLPTWPPSVTATALQSYLTPTTTRTRLRSLLVRVAARLGLFALWPHSIMVHPGPVGLVQHLTSLLGQESAVCIYRGPPRANQKPVLQFLSADGCVAAYVKLATNGFTNGRLANEVAALATLNRLQLNSLTVPTRLGSGNWAGFTFLMLAPVVTTSDRSNGERARAAALTDLGRAFGTHAPPLTTAAWWTGLIRELNETHEQESQLHETTELREVARHIAHVCADQRLELGAAHGDWTPWNIAYSDGSVIAWDWERFRRDVPIGWDAVHFAVESNRHAGLSPRQSLSQLIPDLSRIVQTGGSKSNEPLLVYVTYILDRGRRYLRDARMAGGGRQGPISEWLIPPLTEAVRRLSDVARF